jgi:hypothetical protein
LKAFCRAVQLLCRVAQKREPDPKTRLSSR